MGPTYDTNLTDVAIGGTATSTPLYDTIVPAGNPIKSGAKNGSWPGTCWCS